MADRKRRLAGNVEGEFFVDSTCINCDTCRQLAPETFVDAGEFSLVYAQPTEAWQRQKAFRALVACPTASIGASSPPEARAAAAEFPLALHKDVYYCGFHSEKSFGGSSYFVRHPAGNWLIDSPRYVEGLARRLEAMGGVTHIFLTHRDDVADAGKWARRFGARRVIHQLELSAQPDAEVVLEGDEPVGLDEEFLAIPTPGHTRGHTVLLHREFLFSGDHLWWSRERRRLHAARSVCWYSWPKQVASLERLIAHRFEWVLPGHGERVRLPHQEVRRQLRELVNEQ